MLGAMEGCREAAHSTGGFRGLPDWKAHSQEAQEEAGTRAKGEDRAFGRGPTSSRGSALASHFSSLPRTSEVTSSVMKISICSSRLGGVT